MLLLILVLIALFSLALLWRQANTGKSYWYEETNIKWELWILSALFVMSFSGAMAVFILELWEMVNLKN